jgi:hypothetical protein
MKDVILGIDPGVASGALAVIDTEGHFVEVFDAPWLASGAGGRKEPDLHEMWRLLGNHRLLGPNVSKAFVELIRPFGGTLNAISVHSLSGSEMAWRALMQGRWPVERITPKDWRRMVGIGRTPKGLTATQKKHSLLAAARGIFPAAPLDLVKHDGRAAALLIAEAGRRLTIAGAGPVSTSEPG